MKSHPNSTPNTSRIQVCERSPRTTLWLTSVCLLILSHYHRRSLPKSTRSTSFPVSGHDDVVFIQRIQRILRKETLLSPCLGSFQTQHLTHTLSVHKERYLVGA